MIKKIKWNIDRDSMENKHRALVDLFEPLKRDLSHQVSAEHTSVHFSCHLSFSSLKFITFSYYFSEKVASQSCLQSYKSFSVSITL